MGCVVERDDAQNHAHQLGMHRSAVELPLYVTQTEISRASVGLRSERGPILLAVMLSVGLVAIDSTILATAVPSVVDDLGGFSQFPWRFSVFLLAQAVSVPIFAIAASSTVVAMGWTRLALSSAEC